MMQIMLHETWYKVNILYIDEKYIITYFHTRSYRELLTDMYSEGYFIYTKECKEYLIFERHFDKAPIYVKCILLLIKAPL